MRPQSFRRVVALLCARNTRLLRGGWGSADKLVAGAGSSVSAKYAPPKGTATLKVSDSTLEEGVTWGAEIVVPVSADVDELKDSKITLSRAWSF